MKLSEMFNHVPAVADYDRNVIRYLTENRPDFIQALQDVAPKVQPSSVLLGIDLIIRYLQMFDMPDDISEVLGR